jgi:hypothetical protein
MALNHNDHDNDKDGYGANGECSGNIDNACACNTDGNNTASFHNASACNTTSSRNGACTCHHHDPLT